MSHVHMNCDITITFQIATKVYHRAWQALYRLLVVNGRLDQGRLIDIASRAILGTSIPYPVIPLHVLS